MPDEIVGYNHHDVNRREFYFCLMIKDVELAIIEFKGLDSESTFEKTSIDQIILTSSTKPERSPKKQARLYRFALLNI